MIPFIPNPDCRISVESLGDGHDVVIVDDAFIKPDDVVAFAVEHARWFAVNRAHIFPGPELPLFPEPADTLQRFFGRLRHHFGVARSPVTWNGRLSMVTRRPEKLVWGQRMCHVDDLPQDGDQCSLGAVAYLFHNPDLGGTGFWRLRSNIDYRSTVEEYLAADDAGRQALAQRCPFLVSPPAYPTCSNEFAELVKVVPAVWNRLIVYRADVPHNAHIPHPELLTANPVTGRLTANFFLRCVSLTPSPAPPASP